MIFSFSKLILDKNYFEASVCGLTGTEKKKATRLLTRYIARGGLSL